MEANDDNNVGAADTQNLSEQSRAGAPAEVNSSIVARVQELLSHRKATMFESPDGYCIVIQLGSPGSLLGVVDAEPNQNGENPQLNHQTSQPQDSSKELHAADACSESELGDRAEDRPSLAKPADDSALSGPGRLIAATESDMSLASDEASSEEPLAEASGGSTELNESYDPIKEFEELLNARGLRAPLTTGELLWRKAMYCRYRCRLINLDQRAAQNTWAEVARFVGWSDWREVRSNSISKFLQLPAVDDAGTRDIFDVTNSAAACANAAKLAPRELALQAQRALQSPQ